MTGARGGGNEDGGDEVGGDEAGDAVVVMEGITKRFGEVVALDDVDFELRRGEIRALVGDNGAGKSTLINCLAGVHRPDEGRILVGGTEVDIDTPRTAKELEIETTYQDLALASNLTVTQNIFLGRERVRGLPGLLGVLDRGAMNDRAEALLDDLGIDVSPTAAVGDLSGGERQLVAISRTLLSDPRVIIMDEPTSALSVEGADRVLDLVERLRDQGVAVVLISHNIEYVKRVADRIQVLHHGRDVGVVDATVTRDEIVGRMVSGRPGSEPESSTA